MAIPQMCNLGLSGMVFIGTDVGGFGADVTPELLSRWVQVGCFSPLFRNHSSKGSTRQEPWLFGEETLNINRNILNFVINYCHTFMIYSMRRSRMVCR